MIIISGITISNTLSISNNVFFEIYNSGMTLIETIQYTGQSLIEYEEPYDGLYYITLIDGTSTETCEITKSYTVNSTGSTVISFGGFDYVVYSLLKTSDGGYLVGGQYTTYNDITANGIIKLNTNGSIDTSFDYGVGFTAGNNIYGSCELSDGNYLVCGTLASYKGTSLGSLNNLCMLTPSGNRVAFSDYTGVNSSIYGIIETNDNGYLCYGGFITYNSGYSNVGLLKFTSGMTYDTNFNNNNNGISGSTGTTSVIHAACQLSDGNILLGGWFNMFNNISVASFVKIDQNGSIDTSFNSGGSGFKFYGTSGWGIAEIVEGFDGGYLVGGHNVTGYNETITYGIVKILENGDIDSSFSNGITGMCYIDKIFKTSDYKYLICGTFTTYNSVTKKGIVKINQDGSIDTSFDSNANGSAPYIYDIIELDNGDFILGYLTATYNGLGHKRIVQIDKYGEIVSLIG